MSKTLEYERIKLIDMTLNYRKRHYTLFIALIFALILVGVVFLRAEKVGAEAVAEGEQSLQINCTSCHVFPPNLQPLATDCGECHPNQAAIRHAPDDLNLSQMVNELETRILAFSESANNSQKKDYRYQQVLDQFWQVRQGIYATSPARMDHVRALLSHSIFLLNELEREASSGFWVSDDDVSGITQAIGATSFRLSISSIFAFQQTLALWFRVSPDGQLLELIGLLVVSWCVVYAILRRSPPDDALLSANTSLLFLRAFSPSMRSLLFSREVSQWASQYHFFTQSFLGALPSPLVSLGGAIFFSGKSHEKGGEQANTHFLIL